MSTSTARIATKPVESSTREVRRLATLLEASQALSGTLDLKEGLQRVLEILGRHHGAIRSTVVLLDEDTGEVEVEASAGSTAPAIASAIGSAKASPAGSSRAASRSSCRRSAASRCS